MAHVPLPAMANVQWRLLREDGGVLRDFAAMPTGSMPVPMGGWYRLERRDADGSTTRFGGRFAAGHVVLVTGQSQAEGMFFAAPAERGAFRAAPADPPDGPLGVVVSECDCTRDRIAWQPGTEALGARLLIAGLQGRLGPVPIALVGAATGGAGIAALVDAESTPGARLRHLARGASPLSAAVILGHGTTDVFAGTGREAYLRQLGRLDVLLRAQGLPRMPVLVAALPPLDAGLLLLGSRALGRRLLPDSRQNWATRLGIAWTGALPADLAARAAGIRAAQQDAVAALGLQDGGDLSGITPNADGLHWTEEGMRAAVRVTVAAIADALR